MAIATYLEIQYQPFEVWIGFCDYNGMCKIFIVTKCYVNSKLINWCLNTNSCIMCLKIYHGLAEKVVISWPGMI